MRLLSLSFSSLLIIVIFSCESTKYITEKEESSLKKLDTIINEQKTDFFLEQNETDQYMMESY